VGTATILIFLYLIGLSCSIFFFYIFAENNIPVQHMFTDHFRAVMLSDKLKDLLLLLLAIEVHSSLTGAM
jgi:hypothetical protein